MAYEFHYTPTGTGVISGKEVLEQTEDAINDLGNTAISGVQEALDKAEQALTNSENAVDDAQTALNTANNAEGVAIQAQNDVSNLSGTVTNIGNRVTTAEGNITNLQGRMTTAEGNITNLQGRMTTAEGNIGNLQTAVSTAQATANSAQQTATTARQQSYVFRYSSTALTASSTNSNTLLDNTDNLKVGDKVIDSSGVLFSITAIDTQNSTFTIGTALIDLAQDSDVVHKSGDETVGGVKTFTNSVKVRNMAVTRGSTTGSGYKTVTYTDSNNDELGSITLYKNSNGSTALSFKVFSTDNTDTVISSSFQLFIAKNGSKVINPSTSEDIALGRSSNKWSDVVTAKVNGLEPSSLSLPSGNLNDVIDISSYLVNLDGTPNSYTAPANGWIAITMSNSLGIQAYITGFLGHQIVRPTTGGVRFLMPILKDKTANILIFNGTIDNARFIPCQGNV